MTLTLPYPPSVNHYWLASGHRRYISKRGREFRDETWALVHQAKGRTLIGDVVMLIELFPPDRRRRDIDNTLKAVLDALQHAGCYADDSQVQSLTVRRCETVKGGRCKVILTEALT